MGLNSGEVVVGTIGDDLKMVYTAHGNAVALGERMEQLTTPDQLPPGSRASPSLTLCTEGFDTADLRDAKALLEELS